MGLDLVLEFRREKRAGDWLVDEKREVGDLVQESVQNETERKPGI